MSEDERVPKPPLLASKTTIPIARRDAVDRSRLSSILVATETPLALVVAPAGWGKTTLLGQAAAAAGLDRTVGWLTLDTGDDELHRFWTYVIAALRGAGSPVGESASAALEIPGLDPIDVAIPRLLNDLASSDRSHIIVLDDYHLIDNRRIHETVEYVATYLPPGTRLMIVSRIDPPLPLALWRGRGIITEVRADKLRFNEQEVVELLDIEPDQAAALLSRTEGWAAGLQLVRMAAEAAPDPERRAAALRGDHRHVVDYLTTEVLGSLTEAERGFMIQASVLEMLSAPLCDTAFGIQGSAEMLEKLEQVDPFLTRVDDSGAWYRWHPIIREALGRELQRQGAAKRADILTSAAKWHADKGEIETAVRYLVDAGSTQAAVDLLLLEEDRLLDSGDIETFLALGRSLGSPALESHSRIGLSMAWAAFAAGRAGEVGALLDIVESTTPPDPPSGWLTTAGSIATLRALTGHETAAGLGPAESHGGTAVSLESDASLPGYAGARFALGLVLSAQGRLDEALPLFQVAWQSSDAAGTPIFARLPMAGVLANCLLDLGRVDQARRVTATVATISHRLEETLGEAAGRAIGGIVLAAGRIEMEDGDLPLARETIARAVDMVVIAGHPSQTVRGWLVLADVELALDDVDGARNAVAEARELTRSYPVFPSTSDLLDSTENRMGRSAVRTARSNRKLMEDLTDREMSILRALAGPLSQREIGRELYLSINTVKGYTKSLYRKLGVSSRGDAVEMARELDIL